jgi:hypothetical protein
MSSSCLGLSWMAPMADAGFNDDSHAGFELPVAKRAHNSQSKVNVHALEA